ncbi:hypothetical protein AUC47_04895 [Microbacterium sp. SZ1]|uniref:hypothetical protein n=1 Tax=Microbacterium sp. SZ1 TaxID=1849736 RepID=UPI000BBC7236|nr:hypothetical protein [Microbacterium sp. SZ1]PCE13988.1 hypothetical protein AUC47_04895 [Microbacterium sp. SZ1]
MADGISARVDGAAQLRRTLRKAGADMSDMRQVHKRVGGVILPAARAGAPVGPDAGGHIGSTVRVGASQSATTIRAGNKRLVYGPRTHWGWLRRRQLPNMWITRAAQSTEARWTQVYFDGITDIINTIKGK